MKLKTKFQDEDFDLGEVVEASIYNDGGGEFQVVAEAAKGGRTTFYFKALKELNEAFEDYEEPNRYYLIDLNGEVSPEDVKYKHKGLEELGLTFETKEETEKAVERLRAWKRLKDNSWVPVHYNIATREVSVIFSTGHTITEQDRKDLDLLFSQEDD